MFHFKSHDHNKGKAIKRKPIRTLLAPVRRLFEHMDEQRIPYVAIQHRVCRENLHSWRGGHSGLSVYTLIEWADALDFDIVAVPRQRPPQLGYTHGTPRHGDSTPGAVGMAAGAAARAA